MMRRTLAVVLGCSGCLPEFDSRSSIIEERRVLAVLAEPPEARPGARVRYEALAVGPEGRDLQPRIVWTHCATPKPPIDNNAVAGACYEEPGDLLEQQQGTGAAGTLPMAGCARFGPDPPPGEARPRDPDGTGGFYQPVILHADARSSVHLERLLCNARNAPADVARELAASYVPNQNPMAPVLGLPNESSDLDPIGIERGAALELTLHWRASDVETFVWLDPDGAILRPRRESLLISWFATAGTFETDRSAVVETDERTSQTNRWTAPEQPGRVVFWAVLRDSRGGTAYVERAAEVLD
jgi:hypothetical protein